MDNPSNKDGNLSESIEWTDHPRKMETYQVHRVDGPSKQDGNIIKVHNVDGLSNEDGNLLSP